MDQNPGVQTKSGKFFTIPDPGQSFLIYGCGPGPNLKMIHWDLFHVYFCNSFVNFYNFILIFFEKYVYAVETILLLQQFISSGWNPEQDHPWDKPDPHPWAKPYSELTIH